MLSPSRLPFVALAAVFLAPFAAAQVPIKIDLNQDASVLGSDPRGFFTSELSGMPLHAVALGGKHVFVARTKATGAELWSTDGTAAGTGLIIDLNPGPNDGSKGYSAGLLGGRLFFVGTDGTSYKDIWSTDGTAAGTSLLKAFGPGDGWTSPKSLTTAGSHLYFIDGSGTSSNFWASDGTSAGTHEILPEGFGAVYSFFASPFPAPDGVGLIFSARTSQYGGAVWYTDGTQAGTQLLADLYPGYGYYEFGSPVALGNKVLFTCYTSLGTELYITDGTPAGTKLLIDLEPGPGSSTPHMSSAGLLGGLLYFSADTAATGRELFQTDGTAAGTVLVTDALPGAMGSDPTPLGVVGGKLVLSADLGSIGEALYVLEQGQLKLLLDASPAEVAPDYFSGLPLGNQLLITSSETTGMFVTDGTPAGTYAIPESVVGEAPQLLGEIQPGLALLGGDNGLVGQELMSTDGTVAGTGLLKDIELAVALHGSDLKVIGCSNADNVFVTADLSAGMTLLGIHERQAPQDLLGAGSLLIPYGTPAPVWLGDHGELVFSGVTYKGLVPRVQLTSTDGTQRGTTMIAKLSAAQTGLTILGNDGQSMLLYGTHKTFGPELWSSDGTTGGTRVFGDYLPPTPLSSSASKAVRLHGEYYLSLPESSTTMALWRTDGSPAGMQMIVGGLQGEMLGGLNPIVVGDQIFFVADDGVHGMELWVSDGTVVGTQMVKDIVSGSAGSELSGLLEFEGQLHFFAKGKWNGAKRLWRSDGTEAGTIKVSTIKLAKDGEAVVAGDQLYFVGKSSEGAELWAYDGQTSSLVADLTPGSKGSDIADLTACGDQVYFTATSPGVGREIHLGDAVTGSIGLAFDLNPGPGGSAPGLLTLCGGSLFFEGTGADGDHELYVFDTQEAHILPLGLGWANTHLSATTPTLGSTITMTVDNAPAGAVGVLAMSPPSPPLGTFVQPGNSLWVDPSSFSLLGFGTTATWSATQQLPSQVGLIGLQLNVQAWFLPPGALLAETSNGLRMVLGI